jgi:predicted molibdopterin-dependent oxidoreductase YjgC
MGGLPNVYSGYQVVTSADVQKKFQDAWGAAGPLTIGLTVTEMINAVGENKLRALFVMGENPMVADPDINHARQCLEKAEFLVVQDIFLSETAELAHVVLPGVSFAEKDGTFTGTDRRVQRVRKAIEPIGDALPDWQIICNLAKKMGASGFDYASPQHVMEEIARLTPSYGGIHYDRLEQLGALQWPCPTPDHPGTPYLHKGKFARGVGKFFALPFREPAEAVDDQYPFTLTTGRLMFHFHTGTMTRRSKKLVSEVPEAYIEMHPEDALKVGLNGNRRVRVISRRGRIELDVRITENIKQGVVFIPFHFAEAAANALTNSAIDPVAKIPEYKVCAVKIELAS